jgi:lipopolysaccharide assembly outer membrane protein LptD (OstA)
MRVRGELEIAIGDVTMKAEEADINGVNGQMTLRGNVRMVRLKR